MRLKDEDIEEMVSNGDLKSIKMFRKGERFFYFEKGEEAWMLTDVDLDKELIQDVKSMILNFADSVLSEDKMKYKKDVLFSMGTSVDKLSILNSYLKQAVEDFKSDVHKNDFDELSEDEILTSAVDRLESFLDVLVTWEDKEVTPCVMNYSVEMPQDKVVKAYGDIVDGLQWKLYLVKKLEWLKREIRTLEVSGIFPYESKPHQINTEIETAGLEHYIYGWNKVLSIYFCVDLRFEDTLAVDAIAIEFREASIEYEGFFIETLREIRKNVLNISDVSKLKLYRNYLEKNLGDVSYIIGNCTAKVPYPEEDLVDENSKPKLSAPPFRTIEEGINHLHGNHYSSQELFKVQKNALLGEVDKEIEYRTADSQPGFELPTHKFSWKGTPAQLATFIDILITKGYIDSLGNTASKAADIVLGHFVISGHLPTGGPKGSMTSLFQKLNKENHIIDSDDYALLEKLPHISKLKKKGR